MQSVVNFGMFRMVCKVWRNREVLGGIGRDWEGVGVRLSPIIILNFSSDSDSECKMDFQGVLRQRHHMSRIFFELQLSVQEQNWGDAYECASRCAALQLPAAHRTYLVAVALKAASEAARRGGDGADMWCRVGMATTTTFVFRRSDQVECWRGCHQFRR